MIKQHVGTMYHGLKKELRHIQTAATSSSAGPTMRFGSDIRDDSYAQYF